MVQICNWLSFICLCLVFLFVWVLYFLVFFSLSCSFLFFSIFSSLSLFDWFTKFRSQTITISKITIIIYIKNSNHTIIIISMCHHQLVITMKLTIYRTATITIVVVLIIMPTQQMPMVLWPLCRTFKMLNNKIEYGKCYIDEMHFNWKIQ